jgi:hypothetical protein
MRLRSAFTAASALMLALAVAAPASAATGRFTYSYKTTGGYEVNGFLTNPQSRGCVNLPMAGSGGRSAAYSPRNLTDATAVVFREADCDGDDFYSLGPGASGSERLQVRSVLFS